MWFLSVRVKHGYIENFKVIDDNRTRKNHCEHLQKVEPVWSDQPSNDMQLKDFKKYHNARGSS